MSSHDMKNPIGGVNMGHVMESPDPNEHLLERILSKENMRKGNGVQNSEVIFVLFARCKAMRAAWRGRKTRGSSHV